MDPTHPCESNQMNIQIFYYQKEKVISFVWAKDRQHNLYYNNFAKKVKYDLEIEV